jgi:hypothetical protein
VELQVAGCCKKDGYFIALPHIPQYEFAFRIANIRVTVKVIPEPGPLRPGEP